VTKRTVEKPLERARDNWWADLSEFGERLRKKRKKLGLTQKQMAQRIGVDQSRISRIEAGTSTPKDTPTAARFAEWYELDDKEKREWFGLLYGYRTEYLVGASQELVHSQLFAGSANLTHERAQRIIGYLVEGYYKHIKHSIGQYVDRETINALKLLLTSPLLGETDRMTAMIRLQEVYESSPDNSFEALAIRQHAIYLLGHFASSPALNIISTAWQTEKHPWVRRSALVVLGDSSKFEEFIDLAKRDDLTRQATRTYPRVYYGDQSYKAGVFIDDQSSVYYRTLRHYLSNHPRYSLRPGNALALYTIRDILQTKGVEPLLQDTQLSSLLYRALDIQPLHPLAQREWQELHNTVQPIYDKLYDAVVRFDKLIKRVE
jgi:transcriptional regulator with XRE-family HTH domain